MQNEEEEEREAAATPGASWHSESDTSDTTASTPREEVRYGHRAEMVGEAMNLGPGREVEEEDHIMWMQSTTSNS